jgi:hypothetical protein
MIPEEEVRVIALPVEFVGGASAGQLTGGPAQSPSVARAAFVGAAGEPGC